MCIDLKDDQSQNELTIFFLTKFLFTKNFYKILHKCEYMLYMIYIYHIKLYLHTVIKYVILF